MSPTFDFFFPAATEGFTGSEGLETEYVKLSEMELSAKYREDLNNLPEFGESEKQHAVAPVTLARKRGPKKLTIVVNVLSAFVSNFRSVWTVFNASESAVASIWLPLLAAQYGFVAFDKEGLKVSGMLLLIVLVAVFLYVTW